MEGSIEILSYSNYEEFKFKSISNINDSFAKSLINKHIHFTWHDRKECTKTNLPGKVISYENGKLKIFTMDIIFDDNEVGEDGNCMIYDIELRDISDVFVFDNYNHIFLDLHEFIRDDFHESAAYRITNIWNKSIECMIIDSDSISIRFICRNETNELINAEYPLYFISKIERIGVSQNEE